MASPSDAWHPRLFVGLGILGWGLAILLRVAPHEDLVVGAGLAVVGAALVATASWPRIERLPRTLVGGLGVTAVAGVLGYNALVGAPMDVTKAAIVAYGALLLASLPFLGRHLRLGRDGKTVPLATPVAVSLPVIGAPLAMWALQASFKAALGATPLEAFIHFGLLLPLYAGAAALGWNPAIDGQVLAYEASHGLLRVEVGAACSGIQAMALFGGVLALLLILRQPPGRQFALWSTIGLVGLYATNLLRLFVLLLVGYRWGGEALLDVHAHLGWIFFVAWTLAFVVLARNVGGDLPPPPDESGGLRTARAATSTGQRQI